jgi:two-component system LytT family response regulator
MGMKVFIVDDEKNSREVLKDLLTNFCSDVIISGEAANIEDAYLRIGELKPDLVFLDIQMPTGNGFSLLKKYTHIPFEIIFVTSFDQYAINAIKFSALDYLLKPVDIQLLQQSISRAQRHLEQKNTSSLQIINLLNTIDGAESEQKIAVHETERVRFISIADIVLMEGEINYTHLFTKDNKKYTIAKTLKEFEDYLQGNDYFVRAHRKYIINTLFIDMYTKGDPFIITMSNGMEIEASRRKKQDVLGRLKK